VGPIPPPVYFLVAFVIGALIDYRWDSPMGGRAVTLTLGSLLLAAAAGLVGAAIGQFARAKTTVIPHHRVSALVARGPYRVSRNPMYTAFALGYAGLALVLDMWWALVLLGLPLLVVRYLVIAREEAYLAERFGNDYAAYCKQVRRWL